MYEIYKSYFKFVKYDLILLLMIECEKIYLHSGKVAIAVQRKPSVALLITKIKTN